MEPVLPHPFDVSLRGFVDVLGTEPGRVDLVDPALWPVATLRLGEFQQRLAGQVLFAEGRHGRLGLVEAVEEPRSLLAGRCVEELFLRGEER